MAEEDTTDPRVVAALQNRREPNYNDPNAKPIPADYNPNEESPQSGCETKWPTAVKGGGVGVRVTCQRG